MTLVGGALVYRGVKRRKLEAFYYDPDSMKVADISIEQFKFLLEKIIASQRSAKTLMKTLSEEAS